MLRLRLFIATFLTTALMAGPASAYIGPGAGVSILGALAGVVSVVFLAAWSLVKWCTGSIFRSATRRGAAVKATLPAAPVVSTTGDDERPGASVERRSAPSAIPLVLLLLIALAGWPDWSRNLVTDSVSATIHFAEGFGAGTWHMSPARFGPEEQGVVRYDRDKAYPGYNLEVSATAHEARLMDMEGREVHRWALEPDAISRAWAADGQPLDDISGLYWRRVEPLEDGSLLVLFSNLRTTPYAYGMVKLDWNSNVVWASPRRYHHSVDVGPDGEIYTLYQRVAEDPPAFAHWTQTPFLDEGIAMLDADGNETTRISILEALAASPYRNLLKLLANPLEDDDPLHLNTVNYLNAEVAAKLPFAKEGDLLVSMRNIHTVAIVDPATRKVTWAMSGHWFMQHEPVFTDEGTLLVFDNLGAANDNSRAVEWDPATDRFEWIYRGSEKLPLRSAKYSTIAPLPNGNRLITSSYSGRAIEVTAEGETVWEWRTDRRFGAEDELIGNLMEVIRVPLNFYRREISGLIDKKDTES